MGQTEYHDLAEFGLPIVTADDPAFQSLLSDILSRPEPFDSWLTGDMEGAAVLLNQSGKAIVALAYVWSYTTLEGDTRTNRCSNLGSSRQLDFLNGRGKVARDLGTFILAGSKRLITQQGMCGNNLDVLPPEEGVHGRSYSGVGGGGSSRLGIESDKIAAQELRLDLVIFEDGSCAGPDASGLLNNLKESLELQRSACQKAVTALRNGASNGEVFDIIRPLARQQQSVSTTFTHMAMHQLINAEAPGAISLVREGRGAGGPAPSSTSLALSASGLR